MNDIPVGVYRHYKGGLYSVFDTATHSETKETYVVYRSLQDGKTWIRPLAMFTENVVVDGAENPRFKAL